MKEKYGCDPRDLRAALGPAISGNRYEVGEECLPPFRAQHRNWRDFTAPLGRGKWLLNLPRAAMLQLASAGIPESRIGAPGPCTFSESSRFFSYRRDWTAHGAVVVGDMDRLMRKAMDMIRERYGMVKGRVADAAFASGRNPDEIRLLAVSKTQPPERVVEAIEAGVDILGEEPCAGSPRIKKAISTLKSRAERSGISSAACKGTRPVSSRALFRRGGIRRFTCSGAGVEQARGYFGKRPAGSLHPGEYGGRSPKGRGFRRRMR